MEECDETTMVSAHHCWYFVVFCSICNFIGDIMENINKLLIKYPSFSMHLQVMGRNKVEYHASIVSFSNYKEEYLIFAESNTMLSAIDKLDRLVKIASKKNAFSKKYMSRKDL